MGRFRVPALVAVVLALVGISAPRRTAAAEGLVLAITPAYATAPGFIRVTATIDVSSENRYLEIVADSEGFFRSSRIPLNGAAAPRRTVVMLQNLPPGEYEIRGVVEGSAGVRAACVRTARILE